MNIVNILSKFNFILQSFINNLENFKFIGFDLKFKLYFINNFLLLLLFKLFFLISFISFDKLLIFFFDKRFISFKSFIFFYI